MSVFAQSQAGEKFGASQNIGRKTLGGYRLVDNQTILEILPGRMDVVDGNEQRASLFCKKAELLGDNCFGFCIDPCKRLVQQQQLGFLGDAACHKNALTLSAGKL